MKLIFLFLLLLLSGTASAKNNGFEDTFVADQGGRVYLFTNNSLYWIPDFGDMQAWGYKGGYISLPNKRIDALGENPCSRTYWELYQTVKARSSTLLKLFPEESQQPEKPPANQTEVLYE